MDCCRESIREVLLSFITKDMYLSNISARFYELCKEYDITGEDIGILRKKLRMQAYWDKYKSCVIDNLSDAEQDTVSIVINKKNVLEKFSSEELKKILRDRGEPYLKQDEPDEVSLTVKD